MTEREWQTCGEPLAMLTYLKSRSGRAKLRKTVSRRGCERRQRLFLTGCVRRTWSLVQDHRSREAVEVAERFADGLASEEELNAAHLAAASAYRTLRSTPDVGAYCAACAAAEAARPDFQQGFSVCIYGADVATMAPAAPTQQPDPAWKDRVRAIERCAQAELLWDIFGNPFRPVTTDRSWITATAVALAEGIYQDRAFDRLPILADALQDAGCESPDVLNHCRSEGSHVRGCWVVDRLLAKQ